MGGREGVCGGRWYIVGDEIPDSGRVEARTGYRRQEPGMWGPRAKEKEVG